MSSLFENYKTKRIQRILSAPPSVFLSKPWVKRTLSAIAVISSYLVLAVLLVAPALSRQPGYMTYNWLPVLAAGYLPWVMITCFLLLRRSTRRITSLPDEYLDEREIANRDWAFRMGYVVIRRVGLGLSAVVVLAVLIQYILQTLFLTWTGPRQVSFIEQLLVWFNAYLVDTFADAPMFIIFGYILLLTYVAYSFPVILLAWRDARHTEVVDTPAQASQIWSPELARLGKGYKIRVLWVLAVLVFYFAAGLFTYVTTVILKQPAAATSFLMNLITLLVLPWALYSIYVYFWAMVAQIRIVRLLGMPGIPQKASFARASQLLLLTSSAGLGIAVPISMVVASIVPSYGSSFPLGYAFIAGFALIALQITSFVKASRLAKSI